MLFTTPLFLYVFFPVFYFVYFCLPTRLKNPWVLTGSLVFYAWGEPLFILAVAVTTTADFLLGRSIGARREDRPGSAKALLAIGICLNAGLLVVFKYTNFILGTAARLLHPFQPAHFHPLNILLPLGISFITFEKITYLVDLYRGVGKPAESFFQYAAYVFLFPKLLAGPIIQYHDIEGQLQARPQKSGDIAWGLQRFAGGLGKKIIIADTMGPIADKVFGMPMNQMDVSSAWIGLLAFTLQIYFDFSGYSDMAIGMASMMGFRIKENFNNPYLAVSFTDFWRRWHISLSSWIKNYLYIPLGGNRRSPGRHYFNLWFSFFISGLWHGAHWTFVAWGFYHGFFLVMDKVYWLKISGKVPAHLKRLGTLLLVMMGWVLFRAAGWGEAAGFYGRLFGFTLPSEIGSQRVFVLLNLDLFAMAIGFILVLLPLFRPGPASELEGPGRVRPMDPARAFGYFLLLLLCFVKISSSSFNPFIYFRF